MSFTLLEANNNHGGIACQSPNHRGRGTGYKGCGLARYRLGVLGMAIAERQPGQGVIHHSDQGVQYASDEYTAEPRSHGFHISMARVGNPYENAVMESFFKTPKHEEVYLCKYNTLEEMLERIPYFIEEVYNRKRLHSALGYIPPSEFEEALLMQMETMLSCQTLLTSSVQP
jgi:transposase InsO family protein